MQSQCNEYKRQQSEQYMWKIVDRWIWYSRCDHRKVKLKNGRPTNGLALSTQCDYSISTLFCLFDFHPNLNIHCFQLPILLHSVFTRSLTAALQSRNCIHLPNLSNLCSDCCVPEVSLQNEYDKQGKNIISLRSLTAVLQLLGKKSWGKMFFLFHNTSPSLTHYIIANSSADSYPTSPTRTRVSRVITGIIQPDSSL